MNKVFMSNLACHRRSHARRDHASRANARLTHAFRSRSARSREWTTCWYGLTVSLSKRS